MSEEAKPSYTPAVPWTFFFLPQSLQPQSRAWTERQAALAADAQKIMASWTKHRGADLAASLEAMQKLVACKDPGAASSVYVQWWDDLVKRTLGELEDARRESLRMLESGQAAVPTATPSQSAPPAD